jgi:outer membrane protein
MRTFQRYPASVVPRNLFFNAVLGNDRRSVGDPTEGSLFLVMYAFSSGRPGVGLARRFLTPLVTVSIGLAVLTTSDLARSQTFDEALAISYETNPTLLAGRASLRSTDEGVPRARSGWRPTVSSSFAGTYITGDSESAGVSTSSNYWSDSETITISQSLYAGNRTELDIDRAELQIQSTRASLFQTEQEVLLNGATAYVDVIRAKSVLGLQVTNLRRLEKQLEATRDRFRVGEVTRTDVAQAESRVARAKADLTQAEGDLVAARVVFEREIGQIPGKLSQPLSPPGLPTSREEAVEVAVRDNFQLIQAKFNEQVDIDTVDIVAGELLPSLNASASAGRSFDGSGSETETYSASVTLSLTVPIYQGGAVSARIRGAKENANRARITVESTRRAIVDSAARFFENWQTTEARIGSLKAEVASAEIALEGVEQEATVGARTVLDVLDAEQELLGAQVRLVVAQRNSLVAAYQLLSTVGRMTASNLGLPVEIYDYDRHYRVTRDRYWGTDLPAQ